MSAATEIATNAKVSDEAQALLREDLSPSMYLDLLTEKELFKDAVRYFAHAVPAELATRWAARCVKEFPANPPKAPECLVAAEKWLQSHDEEDRWAARRSADKSGLSSPAACVAMAVFFNGKSITPPKAPTTPPPPFAAQKFAAGAVQIAVVSHAPAKVSQNYKRALAIGKEIAVAPRAPG